MNLIFLLWLLYFLQGVPYGFQTKFLPVFLRHHSLSLTRISFTRLLSLPWLLKPLWAPLVDSFGTKISWVKYNLFGMGLCYLVISYMSLSNISLTMLVVTFLNVMAATQDIAVDSMFVEYFTPEKIGYGNIAQVVGYKTGSLLGGGFLGWLSSSYPWQQLFFLLSVTYILSALLICSPFFMKCILPQTQSKVFWKASDGNEKTVATNLESSKYVQSNSSYKNPSETLNNFHENQSKVDEQIKSKQSSTMVPNTVKNRRNCKNAVENEKMQFNTAESPELNGFLSQHSSSKVKLKGYVEVYKNVLKSEGTKWTILYVLIYKLGEQGMIAILPMFLLDHGVSSSDTAMFSGVFCQFCSILGSLLGGMLFSHWNDICGTLTVLSIIRFLSVCVITWMATFNSLTAIWTGFVFLNSILHLVSGMITTLTFTLMVACSQKCPRILSATHYSTLATFEVLGKLCMVSVSGTVVDLIGYIKFFIVCSLLTLLPTILHKTGSTNFKQERIQVED